MNDGWDGEDRRKLPPRPRSSRADVIAHVAQAIIIVASIGALGYGAAVYLDSIRWDVLTVQRQVADLNVKMTAVLRRLNMWPGQ